MNSKQETRFDELVILECLENISPDEKIELESLQTIRNKEFDDEMDRIDPGWREREEARYKELGVILDKVNSESKIYGKQSR